MRAVGRTSGNKAKLLFLLHEHAKKWRKSATKFGELLLLFRERKGSSALDGVLIRVRLLVRASKGGKEVTREKLR